MRVRPIDRPGQGPWTVEAALDYVLTPSPYSYEGELGKLRAENELLKQVLIKVAIVALTDRQILELLGSDFEKAE